MAWPCCSGNVYKTVKHYFIKPTNLEDMRFGENKFILHFHSLLCFKVLKIKIFSLSFFILKFSLLKRLFKWI